MSAIHTLHPDLFTTYRVRRCEMQGYVLLRDDTPVARGSLATVMLNPNYPAALNHA